MSRIACVAWFGGWCCFAMVVRAHDVPVAAGASVQAAIDAAPVGATLRLAAGTFAGRLTITKPVTLVGAGWDQTIIVADPVAGGHTDAEKLTFATQLEAATNEQEQWKLVGAFLAPAHGPTVTVRGAAHVTLHGLAVRAAAGVAGPGDASLVRFEAAADARLVDCAVVGPAQDGIDVADGSDLTAQRCLVAAVWGTGIASGGSRGGQRPSGVRLADCDVRNCYYAGVDLGPGTNGSTIERCRISGAAWHGIRYDDASPTITGNLIFGNARCGIYASGKTAAIVRGNVFWRNEMDAVSCWFANADTVDHNTVVGNLREGIAVLGDAHPALTANVIADSPVGIACNAISGNGGTPNPTVAGNRFWHDATDQMRMAKPEPLATGNADGDPHFAAADKFDFAVPAGSAAGATDVLPVASPWPLQPAERARIPDGDTRDFKAWHRPAGMR